MNETFGTTDTPQNGALKASAATVMQDLDTLRKDVSKLAGAATTVAGEQVRTVRQRLGRLGQDMSTQGRKGAGYVSEQVRLHPGMAIGLSLGAGLVIGMLLTANRGHLARTGTRTHIG